MANTCQNSRTWQSHQLSYNQLSKALEGHLGAIWVTSPGSLCLILAVQVNRCSPTIYFFRILRHRKHHEAALVMGRRWLYRRSGMHPWGSQCQKKGTVHRMREYLV